MKPALPCRSLSILFAIAMLFAVAELCHAVEQDSSRIGIKSAKNGNTLPSSRVDMREMAKNALVQQKKLEEKAKAEREKAREEAEKLRAEILNNRKLLEQRIRSLRQDNQKLRASVTSLENDLKRLEREEEQVTKQLREAGRDMQELSGIIKNSARDLLSFVHKNMQSGLFRHDTSFLKRLSDTARFPGMDDVRGMAELYKAQAEETGGVVLKNGNIIDRSGKDIEARVLLVGPFTAAYRLDGETGLLSWSETGQKLFALSKPPPSWIASSLASYMDGESEAVPVDISRGTALRELAYSRDLVEQIEAGGPVVWPIILLFAAGVFIVIERVLFLLRTRVDSDTFMMQIEELGQAGKWNQCLELCRQNLSRPLARVLLAGMKVIDGEREDIENALQESILREIPPMERFLSVLGMFAAITPLLGLLGTVTGMINTFQVITLYGSGDPRLMSSGISEALVTTMLGLAAAIPLMLCHNLITGTVERRIADMEEKGVALVNLIARTKESGT